MTLRRPRRKPRLVPLALVLALGTLVVAAIFTLRGREPIDVHWAQVTLRVPDLDCRFWCSVKLSTILEAMPGVRVERFDADTQRAVVRYDAARVDEGEVLESLRLRGVVAEKVAESGS